MKLHTKLIDGILKEKCNKVAIGVSGGADSMCLTHILAQWCKNVVLEILIVDHGLRMESRAEAQEVAKFLQSHNFSVHILTWEGSKPKSNVQSKAREARYNLMYDFCQRNQIKHLFIAHTLNDQAETVLLRIMRGCGIKGLSAMKKVSYYKDIKILRPLLDISRTEILQYLDNIKWPYIDDPSNKNIKFDRIKVRKLLNFWQEEIGTSNILKRISLVADNARRSNNYIHKRVLKIWNKKVYVHSLNFIEIDNSIYSMPQEIQLRFFNMVFKHFKKSQSRLDSLIKLLHKLKEKKLIITTLAGCEINKSAKKTIVYLEIGKNKAIPIIDEVKWFNCNFKLNCLPQENLKIDFLKEQGWKILKNNKVIKPKDLNIKVLYALPALWHNNELICVPHLNYGNQLLTIVNKVEFEGRGLNHAKRRAAILS